MVLKPVNEGSNVGVFICNKSNVLRNLNKLRDFDEILVEKYIPGREIQSAILGKKAIGSIELIPKENFMITRQNTTNKQIPNMLCQRNCQLKNIEK